MLIIMTILVGLLYPLGITAISQTVMPEKANGSLAAFNGRIIGSWLIGQTFSGPQYFHGRPSAAMNMDGVTISGGSNLGPTSQELIVSVAERAARVRRENGLDPSAPVPSDIVCASASGFDPHISPASAMLQVNRVAQARNMKPEQVQELVNLCTEDKTLGIWGQPRVNVLLLNSKLDTNQ